MLALGFTGSSELGVEVPKGDRVIRQRHALLCLPVVFNRGGKIAGADSCSPLGGKCQVITRKDLQSDIKLSLCFDPLAGAHEFHTEMNSIPTGVLWIGRVCGLHRDTHCFDCAVNVAMQRTQIRNASISRSVRPQIHHLLSGLDCFFIVTKLHLRVCHDAAKFSAVRTRSLNSLGSCQGFGETVIG